MTIEYIDLGKISYEDGLDIQQKTLEEVQSKQRANTVLMLEHEPVFTLTRKPGVREHLLADTDTLAAEGISVTETNRGGDITYHGPGQLVVYPIIRLNDYHLNLRQYVSLVEESLIQTCHAHGVPAHRDICAVGVWVGGTPENDQADACGAGGRKIAAIGVRVKRWVTMHGLALNITTNLSHFDYIVPCGLTRPVTSMQAELGEQCPSMDAVKATWKQCFEQLLARPEADRPVVPLGR